MQSPSTQRLKNGSSHLLLTLAQATGFPVELLSNWLALPIERAPRLLRQEVKGSLTGAILVEVQWRPTLRATPTVNPTAVAAGLQQVIQRSNDQQVQAIATRNLSLVADTLTADHFPELANILQDLLNSHVTSIALLNLDWGPIVVAPDGSSAVVTTFETWRIVSNAGTVDDAPQRNDYTLVLDNATWKIKSDVLVAVPTQTR